MTPAEANAVFDLLVKHAGARESNRDEFIHYETDEKYPATEFRFGGHLGFGGKFWTVGDGWRVGCYREDRTPEREAVIEKTNRALAELRAALRREREPTR